MANLINLKKQAGIELRKKNIEHVQAHVKLIMDSSGSMYRRYNNGTVQHVVERLLGIGMNIDVNKSIEVYSFANGFKRIGSANEDNADGFVNNVMLKKTSVGGGTNYSPVMREVLNSHGLVTEVIRQTTEEPSKSFLGKLFGKTTTVTTEKEVTVDKRDGIPVFVFFITDGDNFDKNETTALIKEASDQGVFWQFVGIGDEEEFAYLEHLDNMPGRVLDNANFFGVNDITRIDDAELYRRLLNEFPDWLKEAKAKGIVN